MATIIISLILAIVVGSIILKTVKDKKAGRSSCGSGCGSCPMSGACHKK